MSSITDELTSSATSKTKTGAVQISKQISKQAPKAIKSAEKGICLILTGGKFTTKLVMNAVRGAVFKATKDIKFSSKNINIGELQKSGFVKKVDEAITADVMKCFDKSCRKYKVRYSAMKDMQNPKKPSYIVFYEGKNADTILQAMKEAYSDYLNDRHDRQKENQRDSKCAKLAFFRDGVAAREQERQSLEKDRIKPEPQR